MMQPSVFKLVEDRLMKILGPMFNMLENYFREQGAENPEAEAKLLQIVASNTVLDDWDLWTKTSGYPTSDFNDIDISNINLKQNYPNPFSTATNIEFNINKSAIVTLNLYDLNGSLVKTILNKKTYPGKYVIPFNKMDLNSGIYIYELITKDGVLSKKMMIID